MENFNKTSMTFSLRLYNPTLLRLLVFGITSVYWHTKYDEDF